jgi:predicted outer membrane repeat protein
MMEALEPRRLMAVFTVTSAASTGTGTLRDAINAVNSLTADEIQFAPTVKTINLLTELPTITAPVNINGPGAAKLKINGGNKDFRIFTFDDGTGTDVAMTVEGMTLTGGKPNGNGGAIFNSEDLGLVDVVITKNNANLGVVGFGGGIYSNDGSLSLLFCTISSNTAKTDGGGIYVNGGTLDISSSTIASNKAENGGGVWCNVGNLEIGETTITKNSVTHSGGGVLFAGTGNLTLVDSLVTSNTALVDGGGLHTTTSGAVTVDTTNFISNKATDFGGGIFHTGGTLEITNSNLNMNSAMTGGAVASEGGDLNIDDFGFDKNTAKQDGGAIYYKGTGSLNWSGGNFTSNSAGINGGALWMETLAASNWSDFTMVGNKAKEHGGGVFMEECGDTFVQDATLRGNSAGREGGAMFVQAADMTWLEMTVTGNTAKAGGGALFYNGYQGENIFIQDVEFESNAGEDGGAIFNRAGEVFVHGVSFYKNSAKFDGGAIFNRETLLVTNSAFANNKGRDGGAIFNRVDGNATIRNSTISLNTATSDGGGVMNGQGTMRIDSNIIYGNKVGATANDIEIDTAQVDALSSNNLIGTSFAIGLAGNTGNIIGQNPLLQPFGNYGGLTRTFAFNLASPALNAGNNLETLAFDQRGTGFDREVDGAADIGAYEHEWAGTYLRQVSVVNGKTGTYDNANGDPVKVTLSGNGSAQLYFDTLNDADPALVEVFNTDAKTKVKIDSPESLADLGDIIVYKSIGEFNAAKSQLDADVHIFGTASKLVFADVQGGHNILIDGAGKTSKSAVSIVMAYVSETTLTSAIPISLLQVIRWDDDAGGTDVITAPRLDKLLATGQKNVDSGDFEANLEITGAQQDLDKPVLGTVTIAGDLFDVAWDIAGSIGTMTVGSMTDSLIEAADDFKSLTVKDPNGGTGVVFNNSNVSVLGKITTVKLGKVQTDNSGNGGTDFGLLALQYGTVEYVDATNIKITINAAFPPPQQDGDFFVDFVV